MNTALRTFVVLAALGLLSTWVSSASACPNCKEAIAAEGNDDSDGAPQAGVSDLGKAYSISVLFMLGTFLSVLIGFSSAFYWIYRSAHRTPATGANAPSYDYATSPSS